MRLAFAWDAVDKTENKLLTYAFAAIYSIVPVFMSYNLLGRPVAGADDANIFFIYARNFVHGHGIVYSVGGPHVEGFTSLLYFVLCSICYGIDSQPETVLLVLNALVLGGVGICMLRAIEVVCEAFAVPAHTRLLLMAALLSWLCLNPCYFVWNAVSLMDGGIYGLVLAWGFTYFVKLAVQGKVWKEKLQLSLLLVAVLLVRPEGLLWALGWLVAYAMIQSRSQTGFVSLMRENQQPIAAFTITVVALLSFRELYFGYPLPNTYYAKVSASYTQTMGDGWKYLSAFVHLYGATALLPLAAMAVLLIHATLALQRSGESDLKAVRVALLAAGFGALCVFIPVLEGGDHFYASRMFQPGYPILGVCLLLPVMLTKPLQPLLRTAACVTAFALACVATDDASWTAFAATNCPGGPIADIRLYVLGEFNIAANERQNGSRLNDFFSPSLPTIGYAAAGGIGYAYRGRVYDMMGLNLAEMAHADAIKSGPKGHQSFNKEVFYRLSPDVLLPQTLPFGQPVSLEQAAAYYTDRGRFDNLIFKDLFNDPEFRSRYALLLLMSNSQSASVCYGYFNRSFISKAVATGRFRVLATGP